jgi:hypothetical protein
MILCKAFVETIRPPTPHRDGDYEVIVMGEEPHDYVRTYRLAGKDDSIAARAGIDRFIEEITELLRNN